MIGKSIYDILKSDVTVAAIVGTQIYPMRTPQAVDPPFVVYTTTDNEPTDTKDGSSTLDEIRFDVSMYSDTMTELESLSDAVRRALDRYSGTNKSNVIQTIIFEAEDNSYSNKAELYNNIQTFKLRLVRTR
jgi:hypothetical protein